MHSRLSECSGRAQSTQTQRLRYARINVPRGMACAARSGTADDADCDGRSERVYATRLAHAEVHAPVRPCNVPE